MATAAATRILPPKVNGVPFLLPRGIPSLRVNRGCLLRTCCKYEALVQSNTSLIRCKKGGSDVLERPTVDPFQLDLPTVQAEEGGDVGRARDRRGLLGGDMYRVLLIDDKRHTKDLVAKIIPKVVPPITSDEARELYSESKRKGVAVITIAPKEHAELYAQLLLQAGLRATIEPNSG